jgi:hypothetical protein
MNPQINQYDFRGYKHGTWEYYNSSGILWRRAHYLHGVPRFWKNYEGDGTIYKKKYYIDIK